MAAENCVDVVMLSPKGLELPHDTDHRPGRARGEEWKPRLLAQNMLRHDARIEFSNHMFDIYRFWLQLVHSTTLPRNVTCTDAGVLAAFQAIDRVITSDRHRLARLAYVRLTLLLASLKKIVSVDRKHGRIERSVGYRNASVVLDIYVMAQGTTTDKTRQTLGRRIRAANRWFHLAGSSPLLLITHSDMAEHTVASSWVTNDNIKLLANEILQVYPADLIRASTYLASTAELAVQAGGDYDISQSQEDLREIQRGLVA